MKEIWKNFSKVLLFLLLCFIPTQLGKHFWFDWSKVLGIRIDYLSPTLYLVDLIWIGLFLLVSILSYKNKNLINFKTLLVLGFVMINILVAQNRWIAIYKWLRVGQLVWFGWYVFKNKSLVEKMMIKILPIWIVVEGLLAIGQIAKGGSLNGFWWWLGERSFDFNTIGIAQMSVVNNGIIRAYGTFSHPNSMAGFLAVGLLLWMKFKNSVLGYKKFRVIRLRVFWWVVMWLGVIGIILTGSRTIWVLSLVILVWWVWENNKKIRNKGKGLILVLILLGLVYKIIDYNYPFRNFLGGWDENGLLKRGQLNLASVGMIKKFPLFGVGAGNFLVNLPEYQKNNQIFWFQPVHNVVLLLVSEIGLTGLVFTIWCLIKKFKKNKFNKINLIVFGIIFLSGMMDHYWFTLPQNMWLLSLVLGLR